MNKIFVELKIFLSSFGFLKKLKRWVSPIFIAMFTASFVLWYITKLSHTYTTELDVGVRIAEQQINVRCIAEGVGTNLFGYKVGGRETKVAISELNYQINQEDSVVSITRESLSGALSVRFSDIKIISILDATPQLKLTPQLSEAIKNTER